MGSTLRNDTSRAVLLGRIATAWDKRKDLSLGQLIADSLTPEEMGRLTYLDDRHLAEAIEHFVLHGKKKGDP